MGQNIMVLLLGELSGAAVMAAVLGSSISMAFWFPLSKQPLSRPQKACGQKLGVLGHIGLKHDTAPALNTT